MLDIIDSLRLFTLDCVPVMSLMEKYNYMQNLIKLAIDINTGDYPLKSLKSLMYHVDSVCDKFFIKRVFDIESEIIRLSISNNSESFLYSLDTKVMYKDIPLILEHCIRCDKILFDVLNKTALIKDNDLLLKSLFQSDTITSKDDRVDEGFLIQQVGATLHINPMMRLLELIKRNGWSLIGLESVLPMGVSKYISDEFVSELNGISYATFRVECFERSRDNNDLIVIYILDKNGPNSPYVVLPLTTFYKGYKKNVDDIINNISIQDLVKGVFRASTEEYICVSCLEEMFLQLGTTNRIPNVNTFKEMCRGHYDEVVFNRFYHRYNLECVNTSIIYNIVENLYIHSLGGTADKEFMLHIQYLYGIDSFTDILENEYITYGLFSIVQTYVRQSMLQLYRFAYSYLYYTDRKYLSSLDFASGDYYKYFTNDDILGFNIDDLSTVCKIILSASYKNVRTFTHVDIANLLPLCKYFFTQKWHIIELLLPSLGMTEFNFKKVESSDRLKFELVSEDLTLELIMPSEQKKLYNKYIYEYKILSINEVASKKGALLINTLDSALNKGVFKDSEKLISVPIKSAPMVCFSRPDCKVLNCEKLDNGEIGGVAPTALPYKTIVSNFNTCLNTGVVYELDVEDGVVYFDRVKQNTNTIITERGTSFANLQETTVFSDRR